MRALIGAESMELDDATKAVLHCADLHRGFPVRLWGLREEIDELEAALKGEHEHSPQSELVQIAAYALNWLRQMDDVPSLEWIESEAERHEKERSCH